MTKKIGTKLQVWNNNADMTPGKLHKSDLMKNKHGKIVSIKQHELGKARFNLIKPYIKI